MKSTVFIADNNNMHLIVSVSLNQLCVEWKVCVEMYQMRGEKCIWKMSWIFSKKYWKMFMNLNHTGNGSLLSFKYWKVMERFPRMNENNFLLFFIWFLNLLGRGMNKKNSDGEISNCSVVFQVLLCQDAVGFFRQLIEIFYQF